MVNLMFPGDAVLELLAHAKAARKHRSGDGGPSNPGPGLLFVKDEGIYFMSNGKPGLPPEPGAKGNKVVYAKGYEPAKMIEDAGGDWNTQYQKIEQAVGGDDFANLVPAELFARLQPGGTVKLHVTAHYADVLILAPRASRQKRK